MSRRGALNRDRALTKGSLVEDIRQELGMNDREDEERQYGGSYGTWSGTQGSRQAASSWRRENRTSTRQLGKAMARENERHIGEAIRGGYKMAQESSQDAFGRMGSRLEALKGSAKLSTRWQPGDPV